MNCLIQFRPGGGNSKDTVIADINRCTYCDLPSPYWYILKHRYELGKSQYVCLFITAITVSLDSLRRPTTWTKRYQAVSYGT
jgi:hypothetical protein